MKRCGRCKKEKDLSQFSFKNKAKNIKHSFCKECTRFLIKNHYNKNRQYYLDKVHKRNTFLRQKINDYMREYLSKNSCVDCGESDIAVLEFDHKGIIPKFKAVSHLIRGRYSLEKIKEEVKKCEVRCANCHRRKTAMDFKWYKLARP